MSKKYFGILLSTFVLILSSCTAYKKIPYLVDVDELSTEELAKVKTNYEATIMPGDILSITVNTTSNIGTKDFNLPIVPDNTNSTVQTSVSSSVNGYGTLQNYLVDNDGYIDFPTLGRLQISGLTMNQLQEKLYKSIYPQYLKEEPIINTRILNYKVTVLGEVARPGIYTSENEKMTIFQAIAMAGDLTISGKRDNVLLIRQDAKGERSFHRINLQDKNIVLNNDLYYLRQNDNIYVQPNKAKGNSSQIGTTESMVYSGVLSGLTLLLTAISIITR